MHAPTHDDSFSRSLAEACGHTGRLIADTDWAGTPLGPMAGWPQSLRISLGIVLRSPLPVVMLWGEDGVMLYNDAYSVFAGGRHPTLLGSKVREGWPEVADFNDNVMKVGLAGGTLAYKDQELTLHRRGAPEQVWMNLDYSPVPDETGRPAGVIAIVVETTERVLADRRAALEHERLTQMYEQAPTFMALLSGPQHRFEFANPALQRLVGDRALIGKTYAEALPDAAEQGYVAQLDQVWRSGRAMAASGKKYMRRIDPGGPAAQRFVDYVFQPITDARGDVNGIFIEGSDVTERVEAEDALRELNDTLERRIMDGMAERKVLADLVDSTDIFIQAVDPALRFIAVNRASADDVERLFGVRPAVGGCVYDLLAAFPASLATIETLWRRALADERFTETVPFDSVGGERRWYEMKFSSLRDPAGRRIGAYQFATDVTQRRRDSARLEEAESALAQAQKMQAVGQLAGGIAHDFNNVLQAAHGNFELIRRKPDDPVRVQRWAGNGQQATERGRKLTGQLLAFSRLQRLEAVPLALNALIEGMTELLVRTLGPRIEMRFALDALDATVLSDPTQVEMAILNLAINARDAMADSGTLSIATRIRQLAGDAELPDGDYVEMRVTDSGPGMSAEVAARAFDPFFTTKAVGQGTGLGLSQVYGVAQQAGGSARIEIAPGTEPGTGASLVMLFRRAAQAAVGAAATTGARDDAAREATVLVIDDDPGVRGFIVDSLEALGYSVVEAEDGMRGLAVLDSIEPDLMVVDFAMPGLTGAEVAREARMRLPTLPIVFASGHSDTSAVEAASVPGDVVLRKPFAIEELQAALARVFARQPAAL